MRTVAFVTCLLMLAPTVAAAQETTPLAEVSGGYSVVPEDLWNGQEWWSGWLISGNVNVTRWVGVAAEVGANYYTERFTTSWDGQEFGFTRRFVGVGPRFAARGRRVTGFGQFLVGALGRDGYNEFGIQTGGGVDVWLARVIGIRTGLDVRCSWYEDSLDYDAWRVHTGVVVALGRR